jgi:hypothetical protein
MKEFIVLKKVYWECAGLSEYFESVNGGEWEERTKDYGDNLFTLSNPNHEFVYSVASYDEFLNRKNGMITV